MPTDRELGDDARRLDARERARLVALIDRETRWMRPPLAPELRYRGVDALTPLWSATEDALDKNRLAPPFWAFAWPGGQALARYLLDAPEQAAGKRVLAIAAGAGLEAVAAARAGAAHVVSNDIDPAAAVAAEMNAADAGVSITCCSADLLSGEPGALRPEEADLVLVGDAHYERALAERLDATLDRAARAGAEILVADPGRGFPSAQSGALIGEWRVPVDPAIEDVPERTVAIRRRRP